MEPRGLLGSAGGSIAYACPPTTPYKEAAADPALPPPACLVGAVRAPKLLDGLVGAPGQLQGDVAAPPLVLDAPVSLHEVALLIARSECNTMPRRLQ